MTKREFFLQAFIAAIAGNPIAHSKNCAVGFNTSGTLTASDIHVRLCSSIAAAATKEVEGRGLFEASEEQK